MPTVLIDREAAHDAAQRELSKPIYPKEDFSDRFNDWINDFIYRLVSKASDVPGGWFTVAVLLTLLAVAIVVAVRIVRRTMRTNRKGDFQLFGAAELTAAEHRATAERFAAEGDWATAIRHRLRAVARQLEENGVLNPVPGRTANELATDAAPLVSGPASRISRCGSIFQRSHVRRAARHGTRIPPHRHARRAPPLPPAGHIARHRLGARPRHLDAVAVTAPAPQQDLTPKVSAHWRAWRWVLLALAVVIAVAAVSTYLTAPRPGGRMEAESTSPDGGHALMTLLRERGVDVVVAKNVAEVERAARPDSLLLVAETYFLVDDDLLARLEQLPGDRLLVEPVSNTRRALAPEIRIGRAATIGGDPNCDLPEATMAGEAQFNVSDTYEAAGDQPVTSCYDGAVVRYRDGNRTITAVGSADFMMNSGLLKQGNAALAMNLAGARPRLIWYAPQRIEGERTSGSDIFDLIPDNVGWIVWQLCIVVLLAALWRGRRLGPLVAEKLPVVVRASETVEGRGRLYRSRRARDRAADALRTAALQRMLPRLGLAVNAAAPAVVAAVAERCTRPPELLQHILFGPPPSSDDDLVNLARELDDIERQVAQS